MQSRVLLFLLLMLVTLVSCALPKTEEGNRGAIIMPDEDEEGVIAGQEAAWETQMWAGLEHQEPTQVAPRVGFLAPPFSLPALQGNVTSTDQFCGEDMFLLFWRLECPDCEKMLALLQEMHLSGKTPAIIAINVLDEDALVQDFVLDRGYNFTVLLDRHGDVFRNYELHSFPTTVAVNALREIVDIRSGLLTRDQLERMRELMQRWELKPLIK